MARGRIFQYALIFAAVFLLMALLVPSRASLGLALVGVGSAIATAVTWGIVSAVEAIRRTDSHPKPAAEETPVLETQASPAQKQAVADSSEPAVPTASRAQEAVRDRLRVLVALPSPVLGDVAGELARVSWARLVGALAASGADIEIEPVWPPTLANLQRMLQGRPRWHVLVLEATMAQSGVLFEDVNGRPEIVSSRQLSALLAAERLRLLLVQASGGVEQVLEQLREGADTIIALGALKPTVWAQFAAKLLSALASGDVTGRAFASAMSAIESERLSPRDRPQMLGSNWHSLVDRVTDGRHLRAPRSPRALSLPMQTWFRDHGEPLAQLLAMLAGDAPVIGVVSPPGGGGSPLAIEAGHRVAPEYDRVAYVDCHALEQPATADAVLFSLAVSLRCRTPRELLLADVVLGPLQKQRVLAIIDGAGTLATVERQRLASLAQASTSGCRAIFISAEPLDEVPSHVTVGPMDAVGVGDWLAWMSEHAAFPALADMSEESVRALTTGLHGNPLAIKIGVGLSDYLGLLQSIRTSRDIGSAEGMVSMARQRLAQRDVETLAVLALLPGPLPLDVISATLGRDATTSLVRLERAGFLLDHDQPGEYMLHPYVRDLVQPTLPVNDRLPGKLTAALAARAKSLAAAMKAPESDEGLAALAEIGRLFEPLRRVATWASAESGPAAGRMDAVRDIMLALAPALRRFGLVYEALRLAEIGEEAARRLQDHGARGYLLLEAAESHRENGDIDAAAVAYDAAAHALELAKDYRRVADVLVRLGAMRWESGAPAAARAPLERAYEWLERLQDRAGQVSALMVLGHIAAMEAPQAALPLYQKALSTAQLGTDLGVQVAQAQYAIARCFTAAGDHASAANEYARALQSFTAAGDSEGRLQAYRGLGQAYLKMDDRERAVQVLERAAELEERMASGGDAALDLGRAYLRDRRWQEALEFHQRSLARATAASDKRAMATAHNALGSVHLEMGAKPQAVTEYETAAALWKEIGDDGGLARTYNNLAVAYRRAGRWDRARQYLDEAAKLLAKSGDKDALARVYNNVGLILAAQHEKREAAKFYERSLALKQELGDLYGANITKANLTQLAQRD